MKDKDNIVVDALSIRTSGEKGSTTKYERNEVDNVNLRAFTILVPIQHEKVSETYENDSYIQKIIVEKIINTSQIILMQKEF